MSFTIPLQVGSTANLFFMLPSESASSVVNGVSINRPIIVTTGADGQAKVGYRLGDNTESQYAEHIIIYQIEEGSTATTYDPYSNICPISGWDEANIVVSPTTDAEDGTTYTIQFKDGDNPLTVYGGSLDVVSGELVVDLWIYRKL